MYNANVYTYACVRTYLQMKIRNVTFGLRESGNVLNNNNNNNNNNINK